MTGSDASEACPAEVGVAGLGHNPDVWIVPEFKLVYVATAKNACTSLKWVVAELAREDMGSFVSGLKPYIDDEQVVHNRGCFQNARYPDELDPATARQIHPDNGWFVFGVVRDPYSRLFSAWQDKLLLNEPGFRWAREELWFPQPPSDAETIVSEFARFVDIALSSPEPRLFENDHFRSQVDALLLGTVPYSRIYSMDETAQLRTDLTEHVRELGWTDPLEFRRSNGNPLRANARVFADGVRDKIDMLYAADLEAFGGMWDFARIETAPAWTPVEIREAQVRAKLGRRLGDVRHLALGQRRQAQQAAEQVEKLQRRRKTLEGRLAKLETQFSQVETRLSKLGDRLAKADGRLTKMDGRLTKMGNRLTAVESKVKQVVQEQRRIAARRPVARARRLARPVARRLRSVGGGGTT